MDSRMSFAPKHHHSFSYSFRGVHLRRKCAILLILEGHKSPIPASRVVEESGCLRTTVLNSFARWSGYSKSYVLRHQRWRRHGRHLIWTYAIAARGRHWLEEHLPEDIREELEAELGSRGEYAPSDAAIAAARARLMERLRQSRQKGTT
jgi:hypothetical protein